MAECAKVGAECIRSTVWADGSAGALELARAVKDLCEQPHEMCFAYDSAESLEDKIVAVVCKVYGGCDVEFSQKAQRSLAGAWMGIWGYSALPVCMAKTQYRTMPRLPARPAAERVDVDADGTISGLF